MPYNNGASTVSTGAITGIFLTSAIFGLIVIIFAVIIYWRIFSKAGYSGALSLLMFIPIVILSCYVFLHLVIGPSTKNSTFSASRQHKVNEILLLHSNIPNLLLLLHILSNFLPLRNIHNMANHNNIISHNPASSPPPQNR